MLLFLMKGQALSLGFHLIAFRDENFVVTD